MRSRPVSPLEDRPLTAESELEDVVVDSSISKKRKALLEKADAAVTSTCYKGALFAKISDAKKQKVKMFFKEWTKRIRSALMALCGLAVPQSDFDSTMGIFNPNIIPFRRLVKTKEGITVDFARVKHVVFIRGYVELPSDVDSNVVATLLELSPTADRDYLLLATENIVNKQMVKREEGSIMIQAVECKAQASRNKELQVYYGQVEKAGGLKVSGEGKKYRAYTVRSVALDKNSKSFKDSDGAMMIYPSGWILVDDTVSDGMYTAKASLHFFYQIDQAASIGLFDTERNESVICNKAMWAMNEIVIMAKTFSVPDLRIVVQVNDNPLDRQDQGRGIESRGTELTGLTGITAGTRGTGRSPFKMSTKWLGGMKIGGSSAGSRMGSTMHTPLSGRTPAASGMHTPMGGVTPMGMTPMGGVTPSGLRTPAEEPEGMSQSVSRAVTPSKLNRTSKKMSVLEILEARSAGDYNAYSVGENRDFKILEHWENQRSSLAPPVDGSHRRVSVVVMNRDDISLQTSAMALATWGANIGLRRGSFEGSKRRASGEITSRSARRQSTDSYHGRRRDSHESLGRRGSGQDLRPSFEEGDYDSDDEDVGSPNKQDSNDLEDVSPIAIARDNSNIDEKDASRELERIRKRIATIATPIRSRMTSNANSDAPSRVASKSFGGPRMRNQDELEDEIPDRPLNLRAVPVVKFKMRRRESIDAQFSDKFHMELPKMARSSEELTEDDLDTFLLQQRIMNGMNSSAKTEFQCNFMPSSDLKVQPPDNLLPVNKLKEKAHEIQKEQDRYQRCIEMRQFHVETSRYLMFEAGWMIDENAYFHKAMIRKYLMSKSSGSVLHYLIPLNPNYWLEASENPTMLQLHMRLGDLRFNMITEFNAEMFHVGDILKYKLDANNEVHSEVEGQLWHSILKGQNGEWLALYVNSAMNYEIKSRSHSLNKVMRDIGGPDVASLIQIKSYYDRVNDLLSLQRCFRVVISVLQALFLNSARKINYKDWSVTEDHYLLFNMDDIEPRQRPVPPAMRKVINMMRDQGMNINNNLCFREKEFSLRIGNPIDEAKNDAAVELYKLWLKKQQEDEAEEIRREEEKIRVKEEKLERAKKRREDEAKREKAKKKKSKFTAIIDFTDIGGAEARKKRMSEEMVSGDVPESEPRLSEESASVEGSPELLSAQGIVSDIPPIDDLPARPRRPHYSELQATEQYVSYFEEEKPPEYQVPRTGEPVPDENVLLTLLGCDVNTLRPYHDIVMKNVNIESSLATIKPDANIPLNSCCTTCPARTTCILQAPRAVTSLGVNDEYHALAKDW